MVKENKEIKILIKRGIMGDTIYKFKKRNCILKRWIKKL